MCIRDSVGVGTNAPTKDLHVEGDVNITGTLYGGSPVKIGDALAVIDGGSDYPFLFLGTAEEYDSSGGAWIGYYDNIMEIGGGGNVNNIYFYTPDWNEVFVDMDLDDKKMVVAGDQNVTGDIYVGNCIVFANGGQICQAT